MVLMRVEDPLARSFYEIEAARECWSVRELERQIGALLFQRLAASRDPKNGRSLDQERDVERAIIDRIHDFLLEMGKGFCVVARQKRLTLEGDHFRASRYQLYLPSETELRRELTRDREEIERALRLQPAPVSA